MRWFFFVRNTTKHQGYEYECKSASGGEVIGFPLDSVVAVRFRRNWTWVRTDGPYEGEAMQLPRFVSVELTTGAQYVLHGDEADEFLRRFLPERPEMGRFSSAGGVS